METLARQPRYTPEEYLTLERKATERSEYFNGRIYAMSGASRRHSTITLNLAAALHTQFRGRPCEAHVNDMRVKVSPTGAYTYPDVVALCGKPRLEDSHFDALLNPTLIVVVLSPSTEAHDRGEKFAHYRRLESLQEYILVAQDRVQVEQYTRQGDVWMLSETDDLDGSLTLTSVDCSIPLREIYDRVDFADDE